MNASFPGIARTLYVRPRLRLAEAPRGEGVDWISVRRAIDDALSELATIVTLKRTDISFRAGADSGGAVLVFAYRAFKRIDLPEAEPIVAGVTFLNDRDQIIARADICREESGKFVGPEFEHVLARDDDAEDVAASLAARLARSAEEIIAAVDASPAEPE